VGREKLDSTGINHSSSSCAVSFTQTNPHTSGTSAGGTAMPNPSAQPVNQFHSRTTIEGLAITLGMPQQTMASMFGQGYTQTAPSFSIPNFTSAPYTPEGNSRMYPHASSSYQASYSTVAYTDPIPLSGSSLGFLPNHTYQNVPWFNTYGKLEAGGFSYETPRQFPFTAQPIDMTPAQATIEPGVDPNNLTNQLATILHESFGIEPKVRGHVHQKPYPDYYDQLPYHRGYRVPEFCKFSGEDSKTILEHVAQFILQCGAASATDTLKLRLFCWCFLHQLEQGGQDRVFQFRGGLVNYKAHNDLS
jgi:hypothetical protein